MAYDFSGKKAIVTGGGRGIGRTIIEALCKNGAEVWGIGRTKENLEKLEKEVPNSHGICVDLTDWDATKQAVEKIGPVDMLVNNAAIAILDNFVDVKPDDFEKMYSSNVKPIICVSQVVAKGMIARGTSGAIVNMSSVASQCGLERHTLYSGTKGAVDATTKVMAVELGQHKIRVNSVNPTVVLTDMGRTAWSDPAKAGPLLNRIPQGRFVEPEEVADAVLYLLSDNASMINGHHLPVEGGLLAS